MFDQSYMERLKIWHDFRNQLETSKNPMEETIEFWNKAPLYAIATDPYDKESWPDPWTMIANNEYCNFLKILAIFYTLQLTDRFSQSRFEIHIVLDEQESSLKYLLFVDNQAIGYYYDKSIDTKELPKLECQIRYDELPTY